MSRRRPSDEGTAIIEFLLVGVLMLVPLLYATLMIVRVQSAAVASTQAVREAARAFMMADSRAQAVLGARSAMALAMRDQGFEVPADALRLTCAPDCLDPGSTLHVELKWNVDLPWLPLPFEGSAGGFPIKAEHDVRIDSYRTA